ncbi:unknown [Corallococcus sp. CAG:1435]|nr:unknown [Corallococcus sp. CAG:1435]
MLLLLQRREGRHCLPNAPPRLHRCLFMAKSSADGEQICVCFDDYSSLFALIFSSDSSKYLS